MYIIFPDSAHRSYSEALVSNHRDADEIPTSNFLMGSSQDEQSTLKSAPSFSIYSSPDGFVDAEGEGSEKWEESLVRSLTIRDSSGDFSFARKNSMDLIEEEGGDGGEEEGLKGVEKLGVEGEAESASPPMCLAIGLGIDVDNGFGIAVGLSAERIPGGEGGDVEDHYRKLVEEFPSHPLFLKNYAQLLQSKGDLGGAEEYYLRATLADPADGEILMRYANLVWELRHDKDRAMNYFQRAAEAAPHDCHVLAAYSKFLWDIEDNDGKATMREDHIKSEGEPPPNEQYYLQSLLKNPDDGEIISQYAKMVWELHHDRDKASSYFERAIDASPKDSNVLAAYASFLWEIEDDDHSAD